MGRAAQTSEYQHITALDGLRGLAILMVLCFHTMGWDTGPITTSRAALAVFSVARMGFTGVDLFFVLSGFLITRILLRARTAANYYGVFYYRRVLRIFPLYYAALVLVFFILPAIALRHPERGLVTDFIPFRTQVWFWFNLSNVPTAFTPLAVPLLTHFWTLAIEEQFYFVWPTVVRYISDRTLKQVCVGGFALPLALRLIPGVPIGVMYRLTPFHMEGLFGGAFLGILAVTGELHQWRQRFRIAVVLGCAGVVANMMFPSPTFPYLFTIMAVLFVGLTGVCLNPNSRTARLFSSPFLRRIGDYSYFIYVFHLIVFHALLEGLMRLHWRHLLLDEFLLLISTFAVTFALGAASHRFFEQPILNLKRFVPYRFNKPVRAEVA